MLLLINTLGLFILVFSEFAHKGFRQIIVTFLTSDLYNVFPTIRDIIRLTANHIDTQLRGLMGDL